MLDIKFIREHKDLIKEAATKKRLTFDVDALLKTDDERLAVLQEVETMRSRQNAVSLEMPTADAAKKEELLSEMKELKEKLAGKEDELKEVMIGWHKQMIEVPNIPDASVPDGDDDSMNQEFKVVGEKPNFTFAPKAQYDLLNDLNLWDSERGTKVAGFRGYFLKNDMALLSFAIWQYAMQFMTKKGYSPLLVPSLVRKETLMGTGYLPQGEEDLYRTQDSEYLAGTGEVSTMGYYLNEQIPDLTKPIKFVAFSPCFRREAGSHGKDTKGLIRVHEFYKVEQVILCEANHQLSVELHEELLANAEEFMQALKVPYRVVVNCSGDLGLGQVKKYDIEAWVPSEQTYRETHSISYFHDFQTRRLNTKYKDGEGKLRFAHSLNGTLAATPRLLVSIIENNQQADGTIKVPEVLVPFVGKEVIARS